MENVNMKVLDYIVKEVNLSVSRLGINTQLQLVEKKDCKDNPYLAIDSTPFQTTPMIFKSIKLDGNITFIPTNADEGKVIIAVGLSYRYQTFDDGSNGHKLGTFIFNVEQHCWDKWDGDKTFVKYEIEKVQGLEI